MSVANRGRYKNQVCTRPPRPLEFELVAHVGALLFFSGRKIDPKHRHLFLRIRGAGVPLHNGARRKRTNSSAHKRTRTCPPPDRNGASCSCTYSTKKYNIRVSSKQVLKRWSTSLPDRIYCVLVCEGPDCESPTPCRGVATKPTRRRGPRRILVNTADCLVFTKMPRGAPVPLGIETVDTYSTYTNIRGVRTSESPRVCIFAPTFIPHKVFFNQPVLGMRWPEALLELDFGLSFDMPIEGVTFPRGLQSLCFGRSFNQDVRRVCWPEGLLRVS